jgi:adenylate kinase family enzyme
MNKVTPKRIAIIGLPGSGKSTLALRLSKLLHLSIYHLDTHCFIGTLKRNQEEFRAIQQTLIDHESWIIEGCSITTLEMRFIRADMVIYLQLFQKTCQNVFIFCFAL